MFFAPVSSSKISIYDFLKFLIFSLKDFNLISFLISYGFDGSKLKNDFSILDYLIFISKIGICYVLSIFK
jgi:hypothetical protein